MRELKEHMGLFVSLIKKGEKIILNYRGRPLAMVSKLPYPHRTSSREENLLTKLEEKGLITGGKGRLKPGANPLKIGGKSLSNFVIDSRE